MKHNWRVLFSEGTRIRVCDVCGCRAASPPDRVKELNTKGRLYLDMNIMKTTTVKSCEEYLVWILHAS
jgi:hypothetical protein